MDVSGQLYDSIHYPTITDNPAPSEHATGWDLQPYNQSGSVVKS